MAKRKSIKEITAQFQRINANLTDPWGDYGSSQASAYVGAQRKRGYVPRSERAYERQGERAYNFAQKQIDKRKKQVWKAYNNTINKSLAMSASVS